jgi:hypothetical protein
MGQQGGWAMKIHLWSIILGLFLSACASKRDVASTENQQQNDDKAQHAQMIDGQASRVR